LRGLLILRCKAICSRDGFRDDFGRGRRENLSGAISWLLFSGWSQQPAPGKDKNCARR